MEVLADDSAETVLSICGEAFDLVGGERLRPGSQGCFVAKCPTQRSMMEFMQDIRTPVGTVAILEWRGSCHSKRV